MEGIGELGRGAVEEMEPSPEGLGLKRREETSKESCEGLATDADGNSGEGGVLEAMKRNFFKMERAPDTSHPPTQEQPVMPCDQKPA